jgi:hypothetical protein
LCRCSDCSEPSLLCASSGGGSVPSSGASRRSASVTSLACSSGSAIVVGDATSRASRITIACCFGSKSCEPRRFALWLRRRLSFDTRCSVVTSDSGRCSNCWLGASGTSALPASMSTPHSAYSVADRPSVWHRSALACTTSALRRTVIADWKLRVGTSSVARSIVSSRIALPLRRRFDSAPNSDDESSSFAALRSWTTDAIASSTRSCAPLVRPLAATLSIGFSGVARRGSSAASTSSRRALADEFICASGGASAGDVETALKPPVLVNAFFVNKCDAADGGLATVAVVVGAAPATVAGGGVVVVVDAVVLLLLLISADLRIKQRR